MLDILTMILYNYIVEKSENLVYKYNSKGLFIYGDKKNI